MKIKNQSLLWLTITLFTALMGVSLATSTLASAEPNDFADDIFVTFKEAPSESQTCAEVKANIELSNGVILNERKVTSGKQGDLAKIEIMDNETHMGLNDNDVLVKDKLYSFLVFVNTTDSSNFDLGSEYPYAYLGKVENNLLDSKIDVRGVKSISWLDDYNCHSITAGNNTDTMLIDMEYTAQELSNAKVSGVLTDSEGNPIPYANVIFTYDDPSKQSLYSTTDENGNYTFKIDLNSSGTISFDIEDCLVLPIKVTVGSDPTPIEVAPSIARDAVLSDITVSSDVRGQIVDQYGNIIADQIKLAIGTQLITDGPVLKVLPPEELQALSYELTAVAKDGSEFESWTITKKVENSNNNNESSIIDSPTLICANFVEASASEELIPGTGDNTPLCIVLFVLSISAILLVRKKSLIL